MLTVVRFIGLLLVAGAAAGCTTETKPRLLPFAQARYEIMVGDSFNVTVALSKAAESAAYVDVSSDSAVCRSDPSELRFDVGERVKVTRITGIEASRGLYRRVTFALRDTETSNALLVLVYREVPTDGALGDGSVDGPRVDGPSADAPGDTMPGDSTDASGGDGSDGAAIDTNSADTNSADSGGTSG